MCALCRWDSDGEWEVRALSGWGVLGCWGVHLHSVSQRQLRIGEFHDLHQLPEPDAIHHLYWTGNQRRLHFHLPCWILRIQSDYVCDVQRGNVYADPRIHVVPRMHQRDLERSWVVGVHRVLVARHHGNVQRDGCLYGLPSGVPRRLGGGCHCVRALRRKFQ